ncbi:MAG TPA: maltose alpha-D-glucosyltransferase, partial [Propylenella sp.]|nr:maltose alpha-D-glucosyltransferase [Propylenella sp.]
LGIRDLDAISDEDKARIQRIHLLLAMFNAFQPGVFAVSGWDLVGALPLPASSVESLMSDGDTRWIERGAYDLGNVAPEATASKAGLPRARSLYGPIQEQLKNPDSFCGQLKRLLAVRQAYGIHASRQTAVPDVKSPALLLMIHDLPDGRGTQITALNFGPEPIEETVTLAGVQPGPVVDMVQETIRGDLSETGEYTVRLDGYEGLSLRIVSALAPVAPPV